MRCFFVIAIIAYAVKKNLNNVEIQIFDSHVECIHCGIMLKKKLYLKYEQINDVQYFLNPITSGIRITTATLKYDILVDGAEEACRIIRDKINNESF